MSGARGFWLLTLLGVLFGAHAWSQASIEGVFRYAGGDAERQAVRAAIALATKSLPRGQRVRLAGKLEEVARPDPQLRLESKGASLTVSDHRARELKSSADNAPVEVRAGLTLRQHMDGSVLEQELTEGDLTQRYRYQLGADGKTLTVSAQLTVSGLDEPIVYLLTYLRR